MEYIYEEHNALSKKVCQSIIKKFENDSRTEIGRSVGGVDTKLKRRTDLDIDIHNNWNIESKYINDVFYTVYQKYINHLKLYVFEDQKDIASNLLMNRSIVKTCSILGKYKLGDYFKWHIDYTPNENRLCNCIIYLNENEACTEFLNGIKIKPEAGKVVFFPSTWTYAHRSQPVENGDKYVITCFVMLVQPPQPMITFKTT